MIRIIWNFEKYGEMGVIGVQQAGGMVVLGVVLRGWLRELTIYWRIGARKMVKNCKKMQKSAGFCRKSLKMRGF